MENGCIRLGNILKPIQYTSDDIFFNEALWYQPTQSDTPKQDINRVSDSVLRRSNSYARGLACFDEGIVFCDSKTGESKTKKSEKGSLPSEEQLRVIHDYFVNYVSLIQLNIIS